MYRLNGEHSKIPLDLFAESEPSNGYNEKYCFDFSANCWEQVHWNRTHFHSDIAHFMAFDFSNMFGAQIKFIEQRRQHRAHIHFTVHKTRIPCEFFCLRMSSTHSHAHTHIRSQRSPEKLTIIFVVPCTHINPWRSISRIKSGCFPFFRSFIVFDFRQSRILSILSVEWVYVLCHYVYYYVFVYRYKFNSTLDGDAGCHHSFRIVLIFDFLFFLIHFFPPVLVALFLYYFRRCDSHFFFINATRADTVRAQSNIMFFHHFRLALIFTTLPLFSLSLSLSSSTSLSTSLLRLVAKKTANDGRRRQVKHWFYGFVLFADAAAAATVTAIVSHQITFLPFTRSCSRRRVPYTLHCCRHSVSLNLNLWLFAFFSMLLLFEKFYHFNVFAMNFHAIICLCSTLESERVIALRRRRHRSFFLWIFLIGISEAEITNWNHGIKIVNEQMRINGKAASKQHLLDPILSFRPHA